MRLAEPLQLALLLVLIFRAGGLDIPMEGMSGIMQIKRMLIECNVAFKDWCVEVGLFRCLMIQLQIRFRGNNCIIKLICSNSYIQATI